MPPNPLVMESGYCFAYDGRRNWRASSSEKWPIEVYTITGKEVYVGRRKIDTYPMNVWKCPDGKFRAQTYF